MMNSISECFKNNPIHDLNHIIPLDFKNVTTLPDSHTWSTATTTTPVALPFDIENDGPSPTSTHESLSIVDLTHPHALALIRQASEKWGMFQVVNHGVPCQLIRETEEQTRRLFALPAGRKLLAFRSPDGLKGYGLARISTFFTKQMWHEGFTIMGSPLDHATQLWPHDTTDFCNVMEEYQKEMLGLSEKILGLMFQTLGLTQADVKWFKPKNGHNRQPQAVLQLNSYPLCPNPSHAMGLAPHTDSSLLTLLHQSNNTSGLQVLGDTGWVPVQPVNGALIVNVGDLMHVVSNGRFKTALHRAVASSIHHRISVAYFYGPPRDVKISPLMKLIDRNHPLLYRSVTWKEYLDAKATHFNEALELIKYDVLAADECNQL